MRALLAAVLILAACGAGRAERAEEPAKRIALTFDDAPTGDGPVFSGTERAERLVAAPAAADSGPVAFFVTTKGFAEPGGRERVLR